MDISVSSGHGPDTRHPIPWASLHQFGIIWTWLAGLLQLTEQEEEDAGIYLGD
jgi:hypothetical protein